MLRLKMLPLGLGMLFLGGLWHAAAAEGQTGAQPVLPPSIDEDEIQAADYAESASLWKRRKDKDPGWKGEAANVVAAEWANALERLNKAAAASPALERFLPSHPLKDKPVKSFDAKRGIIIDIGGGATSSLAWKSITLAQRLDLLRLSSPEQSAELKRGKYCLAALHGRIAEAAQLYEEAGKPDPAKGPVETFLAGEVGKHTEALQKGKVQTFIEGLAKVKESKDTSMLDTYLRLHEGSLVGNPFAAEARAKIAEAKAELEKPQAAVKPPAAGPQQPSPQVPPQQGRKIIFHMDFSKGKWGKLIPPDGKVVRGEVIPDPTGGGGKVLAPSLMYELDSFQGAEALVDLPAPYFYTVGPNTYFEVEVYYEGMTDPGAYIEVRGKRGEQTITGRLPIKDPQEKTWKKVSLNVSLDSLVAFKDRDADLPRTGERFIRIGFEADIGRQRRITKLYFRNLVIYELPEKK